MKKLVLFMHISLDGFVAGPNGEMDWIHVDEQIFDYVVKLTDQTDIAMYGRKTYQMMDSYWPNAGSKLNASKHDIEHSRWYNRVQKVVISNSLKGKDTFDTKIIGENLIKQVQELKQQDGKNIMIFGSPTASHTLMQYNLIDEYWLFLNPILLGSGIPIFKNINEITQFNLIESKVFASGVVELHYGTKH
jgi:dihydrofolate reductase